MRDRRRLARSAFLFCLSTTLGLAATWAVHYEIASGAPGGAMGTLIGTLEVVFIAGIIPLALTALHSLWVIVAIGLSRPRGLVTTSTGLSPLSVAARLTRLTRLTRRRRRHDVPPARLRP